MDLLQSRGDFYATLPSNASMQHYPENVLSQYTVHLNTPLDFSGVAWEVALVEIIYPTPTLSTFQLPNGTWPAFSFAAGLIGTRYTNSVLLPIQTFTSGEQLVDAIYNWQKDNDRAIFKVSYDASTNRITFENLQKQYMEFFFPARIALLLGFAPDVPYHVSERGEDLVAPNPVDLNAGVSLLYVYSSICEPQIVGDKLVPLLRVVPQPNDGSGVVCKEFVRPHYVPVPRQRVTDIQIDIFTDSPGERVPFPSRDRVIAKLHLRKTI